MAEPQLSPPAISARACTRMCTRPRPARSRRSIISVRGTAVCTVLRREGVFLGNDAGLDLIRRVNKDRELTLTAHLGPNVTTPLICVHAGRPAGDCATRARRHPGPPAAAATTVCQAHRPRSSCFRESKKLIAKFS